MKSRASRKCLTRRVLTRVQSKMRNSVIALAGDMFPGELR
jgi:hypothetical protein